MEYEYLKTITYKGVNMNNAFKVDWLETMIKANKELLDQAYSEHLYEDMCKHASLIKELNSLLSKYRLSGRQV